MYSIMVRNIHITLQNHIVAQIDDIAQELGLSRSETVARLVNVGIKTYWTGGKI